jgi:hypothetical protein
MSTEPDGSPIRKPHDMMHQHLLGGESEPPRRASDGDGTVRSTPRVVLRIEGAVILGLAVFGYVRYGGSWWLFSLLLLVPDIGAIGYAAGPRFGAFTYNASHTYIGPAVLVVMGTVNSSPLILSLGLIWFAHLGMDRAAGYGLKYGDAFGHTHLGFVGRDSGRNASTPDPDRHPARGAQHHL